MEIAVDEIEQPSIFVLREIKTMDVDSLAADIDREGLISAVTVRLSEGGRVTGLRYQLIVGHRRLAAIQKLKRKTIRARVVDRNDTEGLVMAMSENLERKDMSPLEEARAIEKLYLLGMKEKELAKLLGKSIPWISQRRAILKMSPSVQLALENGEINAGHIEKGFSRLKHPQDQTQLLEDLKREGEIGSSAGVETAKHFAENLVRRREHVEELAAYFQKNADRIKYQKCPRCGGEPDPHCTFSIKSDTLRCLKCYRDWNTVKGMPKSRETTLGGTLSSRETPTAPRGETVVKVEAQGHKSALTVQQFFDKVTQLISKNKAVLEFKVETDYGMDGGQKHHLNMVVSFDPKKVSGVPVMELEPKIYKSTPHVTKAQIYHSWGGSSNKGVLENRELFWALEKAIDPKVAPAEISREALIRLVIDHVALSRGKELLDKDCLSWKVHTIHRDYTAWMVDPKGKMELVDEEQLRELVKSNKKVEKKKIIKTVEPKVAAFRSGEKKEDLELCDTCGYPAGEPKIPLDKKTVEVKVSQKMLNQLGELCHLQRLMEDKSIPVAIGMSGEHWVVTSTVHMGGNCEEATMWRLVVDDIRYHGDRKTYDKLGRGTFEGLAVRVGKVDMIVTRPEVEVRAIPLPKKPAPGTCQICGCTEDNPCIDEDTDEPCGWANKEKTLCTACAKLQKPLSKSDARQLLADPTTTKITVNGHGFVPHGEGKKRAWSCEGCGHTTNDPLTVKTSCPAKKKGK